MAQKSLDEMGNEIFEYFIEVTSGKKTKSEILSLENMSLQTRLILNIAG